MQKGDLGCIEQIEERIVKIQRSHIALQKKLKNHNKDSERFLDDSTLEIIDILDLIDTFKLRSLDNDALSNALQVIKKIEKILVVVLRRWQAQENIITKDNKINVGKTS